MELLFDIGGTQTRVAVSRDGQTFDEPVVDPTAPTFDVGMEQIITRARSLVGGERVRAIAGGIAGPLNRDKTQLVGSPNLPDWVGQPIATRLSAAFAAPVRLENDTALVGLGEATVGAGKGYDLVAYMTISTGVNGVLVTGGRIAPNRRGFEIGQQIIDLDGGDHATLEQLVGGAALRRDTGVDPRDITDALIWQRRAEHLAVGLANTILHWSPDVVVLGGSMVTKTPGIALDAVQAAVTERLTIFPERPPLVPARLGSSGGLYGALALLRQSQWKEN